jgi:hypothetical protein
VAIAGKWCQGEREQRTGCRSGLPWPVVVVSGCWRCSITGSSVGPSSSRLVKPATKRRRRQRRAGPGGDRRQVGQGERGTAYRLPIGVAVDCGRGIGVLAGIGCRRAPGLPLAWPVLAVLDHRQFGRAFVFSIGEAGHEATTAPASSGAVVAIAGKWCQVERGTAHRLPIGVAVAWSGSRGAGNPRLPLAWPVLAVLDHRQFGRAFVLSIGEAGHEATTAPASSGAGWRSPASGARANARQRTGCRSGLPWPGQALGVRAIRGCRWRGPCWQCSITGSSVGPSSSRSVKPATKRRRRQRRAVPGGDRRQVVPGRTRDSVPAADRGCRGLVRLSGCGQSAVAAGVARAGSARSPAVRSGFRPLDR